MRTYAYPHLKSPRTSAIGQPMKRMSLSLVCGLTVFGLGAVCYGYILPARQILTFMIRKLGSGQTLVIEQKTVLYDPAREEAVKEFKETLYYGYPDRFRSEVSTGKMEQLLVASGDDAVLVLDGKMMKETGTGFDHFKDLLLYTKTDVLVDRLVQLGIDMEVVSLGRFEEKIAYVIGAKYPDESISQVWIEKDSFRPLRLLLGNGHSDDVPTREIQYADFRLFGQGKHYPGRILFLENGKLVRMHVMETFTSDPTISEDLFDIGHLRRLYGPSLPPGLQEEN